MVCVCEREGEKSAGNLIFLRVWWGNWTRRWGEKGKTSANRLQLGPRVCAAHIQRRVVGEDVVAQFLQRRFGVCGGKLSGVLDFLPHFHVDLLHRKQARQKAVTWLLACRPLHRIYISLSHVFYELLGCWGWEKTTTVQRTLSCDSVHNERCNLC